MPFVKIGDVKPQVVERMVIKNSVFAVINLRDVLDFQVEMASLWHI